MVTRLPTPGLQLAYMMDNFLTKNLPAEDLRNSLTSYKRTKRPDTTKDIEQLVLPPEGPLRRLPRRRKQPGNSCDRSGDYTATRATW